jgi:hypothetical protein
MRFFGIFPPDSIAAVLSVFTDLPQVIILALSKRLSRRTEDIEKGDTGTS